MSDDELRGGFYPSPDDIRRLLAAEPLPFSTTDSHDPVRSPEHYRTESGVEVIDLVEDLDFLTGNIVKYAFRAGKKRGSPELQDLEKCESYLNRAIARAKRRKA